MTDRLTRFRSLPEAEGRVLLLIKEFSGTPENPKQLEGRVKLAKLDFLVRYPRYLARVLADRNVAAKVVESVTPEPTPLQDKMIRYRYGPWDPSYYAVLGSLIGRGLVDPIPFKHGIGYRVTGRGRDLITAILEDETWGAVNHRAVLTRRHLDLSGSTLKDLLYEAIPEMTNANWHASVD